MRRSGEIQREEPSVATPSSSKRGRGDGEGSIQQVKGRAGYRAQIRMPDGSRPTRQCKTKKEAADWIAEQRLKMDKGQMTVAKAPRLGEWMDQWFAMRTVNPRTIMQEQNRRKLYFEPLEKIPLDKLTAGTIKRWLDSLDRKFRARKPGVGEPHNLRHCYALLSSVINGAIDDGLLTSNPLTGVKRPKVPPAKPKYLSEDELDRFLKIDWGPPEDPRRMGVMLMLWLGLRRGEALGLVWEDVDLETGVITIRKQLSRVVIDGKVHRSLLIRRDLKTDYSRRSLAASPGLLQALQVLHTHQGEVTRPTDFIVSFENGQPIDPDAFAKWMKTTAAEVGIDVSPHRLRHTAATTMLNKVGSLEEVSSLLGNADIKTTSIYARITPDTRHAAAKALGSIFDQVVELNDKAGSELSEQKRTDSSPT